MNIVKTLVLCLALVCSTTAHADWQYTRWGMTPAEVAAASNGMVEVGTGDLKDAYDGAQIGATGTYAAGKFRFQASFYFIGGKLADVHLRLVGGDPYALKASLLGVYGKPFSDVEGGFDVTTWHDQPKNNRVDLIMIDDGYTTLEYRPLLDDSAPGL